MVSHGALSQGKEADINQIVIQTCFTICAKYQGREYGAIQEYKRGNRSTKGKVREL